MGLGEIHVGDMAEHPHTVCIVPWLLLDIPSKGIAQHATLVGGMSGKATEQCTLCADVLPCPVVEVVP